MAITWKVCILELTIFYAIISGRHLGIHVCLFGLYLQIGNEHRAKQTVQKILNKVLDSIFIRYLYNISKNLK